MPPNPNILKWSSNAKSLWEKALLWAVYPERGRSEFSSRAGPHRVCGSHFDVSNRLSAPGRSGLNKRPGEPVFILEGSSNIQRSLRSYQQNTKSLETQQMQAAASHFERVFNNVNNALLKAFMFWKEKGKITTQPKGNVLFKWCLKHDRGFFFL